MFDMDRRQFRESRKNQGFGGLVVPSVLADIQRLDRRTQRTDRKRVIYGEIQKLGSVLNGGRE